MTLSDKLHQEQKKLCGMDLNDPGILAQSQVVDELIVEYQREVMLCGNGQAVVGDGIQGSASL